VVNSDHVPVGFCVCWQRDSVARIEPLNVHPDYQGSGLGKSLEVTTYQILKRQGVGLIKVDHTCFNEKAIVPSLKTGFRQKNNALRYYVDIECQDVDGFASQCPDFRIRTES